MKYRSEIDGLRALAVIPVILFHADFSLLSGGFIGVDIFFVISGYLITSIILADIERGSFSILTFYERRARRILPSLFVVMACCIPFSLFWMSADQIEGFFKSLLFVSLFASNILFSNEGGYFDGAVDEKPLLHTWSLAVEEQYYILFPVFLVLAWKVLDRKSLYLIVVILLASLIFSEIERRDDPIDNFYLLRSRAWELLSGSVAAFILLRHGQQRSEVLAWVGLILILAPLALFTEHTPTPSLYTAIPVLGVVLLILYADATTRVARLLSTRGLVFIGLISYSAYLWHQPLFAFAKLSHLKPPAPGLMAGLTLLSFVLAALSWKFIETPFRQPGRVGRKPIFVSSLAGIAAFSLIGYAGHTNSDKITALLPQPPNIEYLSFGDRIAKQGKVCKLDRSEQIPGIKTCSFGDVEAARQVVVIGDSHMQALAYALEQALRDQGVKGTWVKLTDCQIIPFFRKDRSRENENCAAQFETLKQYISERDADVIVHSRWTFKLYPIAGQVEDMPYRSSEGYVENNAAYAEYDVLVDGALHRDAATKSRTLARFIDELASAASALFLVYPVPETGIDIERANRLAFRREGRVPKEISIPISDYDRRNAFVDRVFDAAPHDGIRRIRVKDLLCDTFIADRCAVQSGGAPLYLDDDHLSEAGARLVVDEIVSQSDWAGR